jgi:hypothetical protein
MITPTSGTIVIPQQTADGIWIQNLSIFAPTASRPISATMRVAPFSSTDGTIFTNMSKTVSIPDVTGSYAEYPSLAIAMSGILQAVQDVVSGKQLF